MGIWLVRGVVVLLALLLAFSLFVFGQGCNEEQRQAGDRISQAGEKIGNTLQDAGTSPAMAWLPLGVRTLLEIGGGLILAGVGAWEKWRASGLWQTGRAIARGIEKSPDEAQQQIKSNIAAEMTRQGIYGRADAIVNQLKAA